MFRQSKKHLAWEVVETIKVDPLSQYHTSEDIVLQSVSTSEINAAYIFEVPTLTFGSHLSKVRENALIYARRQLLKHADTLGYNILLVESWQLTIMRRGKATRVEVDYCGRPGFAHSLANDAIIPIRPPFMAILHARN